MNNLCTLSSTYESGLYPHLLPPNSMPTLGFSILPSRNTSPGAISLISEQERVGARSVSKNGLPCPTGVLPILFRQNAGISWQFKWRIAAVGRVLCFKLCIHRSGLCQHARWPQSYRPWKLLLSLICFIRLCQGMCCWHIDCEPMPASLISNLGS